MSAAKASHIFFRSILYRLMPMVSRLCGWGIVSVVGTSSDGGNSATLTTGEGNAKAYQFQARHMERCAESIRTDREAFELVRSVELGEDVDA